jgi:SAM-dependent methyltransferase
MSAPEDALDAKELGAYAFNVWGYKQGEMVSLMIHLGDRLGLYRALAGAGPLSAEELAERTGLKQRWLLEWLRGQTAARLLDYHEGDRFELSAIAAHRTERMLGPWTRRTLVPQIIPALDGVEARLRAGARVADVGCGAGVALLAMAEAYPASRFDGYDPSGHAIERARSQVKERGLSNVELHEAGGEKLPHEATYDFVITLDCIHDMTRPAEVIAAIRRALQPDGTWLIKDIRSAPRFEDNLRNPLLAMFYGFSVSACMSSALSEPGGAGLGTLGFNPEVAERMTREAGFTRFLPHDFEDPANLYYEVRP